MAVDTSNSVYITEYNSNSIEKFDSTGTRVDPFITSGGGSAVAILGALPMFRQPIV